MHAISANFLATPARAVGEHESRVSLPPKNKRRRLAQPGEKLMTSEIRALVERRSHDRRPIWLSGGSGVNFESH